MYPRCVLSVPWGTLPTYMYASRPAWERKTALIVRLSIPGDVYYDAYRNGCALGEYNIDAELAKKAETGDVSAIETLETRKQERTVKDLRNQLFGI